jgi:hypothetical protein
MKGVLYMRNLLMTVMLLAVVALLYMNIVSGEDGIYLQIQNKGNAANAQLEKLNPNSP